MESQSNLQNGVKGEGQKQIVKQQGQNNGQKDADKEQQQIREENSNEKTQVSVTQVKEIEERSKQVEEYGVNKSQLKQLQQNDQIEIRKGLIENEKQPKKDIKQEIQPDHKPNEDNLQQKLQQKPDLKKQQIDAQLRIDQKVNTISVKENQCIPQHKYQISQYPKETQQLIKQKSMFKEEILAVLKTQHQMQPKKQQIKKQQQSHSAQQSSTNPLKQFLKNRKAQKQIQSKTYPLAVQVTLQQSQQKHDLQSQKRKSSDGSILQLPESLKQQTLNIISHETQNTSQILEKVKQQIKVQIIAFQQKGNALSKYMLYTIKGEDMHGPFLIKRKFSEFVALRKILIERWPGCYIPGLRNKFAIKNKHQQQETLKKILINFLVGLSFSKYFYYKEEVQLFLRSPDIDAQDMVKEMPALRTSDLVSRFQYALGPELQQKTIQNLNNTIKITNFHKRIKKISTNLEKSCQQLYKLAQSHENYTSNLYKFNQTMKLYEHISLAQFTQNNRQMTILVKDQQKSLQKLNLGLKQYNPYYQIYRTLLIQQIDTKSLSDILLTLQVYYIKKQSTQKQIQQNEKQKTILKPSQQIQPNQSAQTTSSTIKSIPTVVLTSKKYKQQKLAKVQQTLKKLYEQQTNINRLISIVQYNVVNTVIPMFKLLKRNKYCNMLKQYVQVAQNQIIQKEHIWRFMNAQAKYLEKFCKEGLSQ